MAYYRYQLENAPEGRVDGSEMVNHDITGWVSSDNINWTQLPGYHKTFVVPAAGLASVMAMPDSTGAQKTAKNAAYKQLLVDNRNAQPVPMLPPSVTDWSKAGMEQYVEDYDAWLLAWTIANTASANAASDANEYITVTLDKPYPLPFSL